MASSPNIRCLCFMCVHVSVVILQVLGVKFKVEVAFWC